MGRSDIFREFHKKIYTEKFYSSVHYREKYLDLVEVNKNTVNGDLFHIRLVQEDIILNRHVEILDDLKKLEQSAHAFIRYQAYFLYVMYYLGYNNPSISKEKVAIYSEKMSLIYDTIEFENDWEKYYLYHFKYHILYLQETDLEKRLLILNEATISNAKIPEYGYIFKEFSKLNYGHIYMALGQFQEAIININIWIEMVKGSDIEGIAYVNIAMIYILMGDLTSAEKAVKRGLECLEDESNYWVFQEIYSLNAEIAEQRKHYKEAEQIQIELIERSLRQENKLLIFKDHYSLFLFYFRMFNLNKEKNYLNKLRSMQNKMEIMAENSDDITITRLNRITQALLLKLGGIIDKGNAIKILEEFVEIYPNNLMIKMNLIELYFEDLSSDFLGNSKKRIDELLIEIQKNPIVKNPLMIANNHEYHILIANYTFFLNGNIDEALKMLNNLKSNAKKIELKGVVDRVKSEIKGLERQISKWSNISLSTKERLKKSNMEEYVKMALQLVQRE